jgi:putative MATE family efflux protein
MMRRPGGNQYDRAIFALAVPALGALAADPIYSLVDTAFVGHLGTPQLGAVAIGTAAFTASFWMFSFLAYGVTPRVARALGRGDLVSAASTGVQALYLAVAFGAAVSLLGVLFAGPIVRALGAGPEVATFAEPYLRIRILSSIPVLLAQVGHGWLRGDHDTRTPMYIAIAGACANVLLDYVLIYPAGMGVNGAAWATLASQTAVAAAFLVVLARRFAEPRWRFSPETARPLRRVGADLAVRTGALLLALTVATSIAARMGEVPLAAWQIAMQMFLLLALVLDSIAIAGQALIARDLGAGSLDRAMAVGRRLMSLGLILGLMLLAVVAVVARPLAGVFTDDPAVIAAAGDLILWVAAIQPLSAIAFTLDGILIGASDTRFLAGSMAISSAIFVSLAFVALAQDWGTGGLAVGATIWLVLRSATTGTRFVRGRWAVDQ